MRSSDAPFAELAPLARALGAGELPLLDYVDRLAEHFARTEPQVLAFVPEDDRFALLRFEAEALLARFPEPASRPPLFGVPIGVKDIFHVAGFATGAGSKLPPAELAGPEGEAVGLLRRAGALVLGKTVSTEFAYFAPGPTRNPHDPTHTPGGSSSGSAAAVAAGLCPLTLGTQTIGSITRPAAYCGVVGFKPSRGRIPTSGVIELARSFDHVGFFTTDAASASLVAAVLCADWRPELAGGPASRALGLPVGPYLDRATAEGRAHFDAVAAGLAAAGWEGRPVPIFADLEAIDARHRLVMAAEFAAVHARWLPRFRPLYRPQTLELVARGQNAGAAALAAARQSCAGFAAEIAAAMEAAGVELWLAPAATGPAPAGLDATGDPILSLPWTQAGMPALAVPSGKTAGGLPLGVQVVGRVGEDEAVVAAGMALEAALADQAGAGGPRP